MNVFWMILLVFLAGALGGVVNALMTDNGFILPKSEKVGGTASIVRPGFFGNTLIGGVAAVISWGLYGPLANYFLLGGQQANTQLDTVGLSMASLVGAILIGVGGARWLTSEVDKNLLRAAAAEAAGATPSTQAANQIAASTPASALNVARQMPRAPTDVR